MDSSSPPLSSDGDEVRDAAPDSDLLALAARAAAAAPAATSAPAGVPAPGTVVVPCAAARVRVAFSGAGHSSGSKAKARRVQIKLPAKCTATKTKSRLAVEGAPAAPTTQEASSSGGVQLQKSLGLTMSGSGSQQDSPQPESVNDSEAEPIEIDDDDEEEEEEEDFGPKRKLRSVVWNDFKRVKVRGNIKAQCLHCHKRLGGVSRNGTKHLHDHLKSCTLKKIKLIGQNKTLAQSSLRFSSQEGGKVSVENYTFDPEVARRELAAMIILHEYPLSMVDHIGFRRFVSALQPLFKIGTRNTIRKDIVDAYQEERKKALSYMAATKSRVAITTDMWTSENQKRGYMAVTAHFIDDSWTLRNIIMRDGGGLNVFTELVKKQVSRQRH